MEVYYYHPFKSHFYDFGGSYYLLLDQIDFFHSKDQIINHMQIS